MGVIETAALLPLTKRNRFLTVEHVQLMPPYDSDGKHTSMDLFSFTKLTVHALNREKSTLSCALLDISSSTPAAALIAALRQTIFNGPGPKFAWSIKSIMKVGRSS